MNKRQVQWSAQWFALPKVRTVPRPGTIAPVSLPDAPLCACGCGRRILPLAQQHASLYFSRACREKHLRIEVKEPRGRRS